jgi:hypothetical protein
VRSTLEKILQIFQKNLKIQTDIIIMMFLYRYASMKIIHTGNKERDINFDTILDREIVENGCMLPKPRTLNARANLCDITQHSAMSSNCAWTRTDGPNDNAQTLRPLER